VLSASVVSYFVDKVQHLSPGLVYGVVALLVFGETALFFGFVLPGEIVVIVGGFVASQGRVNVVALCALVVATAIAGETVGYEVGRHYGARVLSWRALRRRRVALERALEGLRRRGPIYVFVGRFTAFLRAVMPSLAGLGRVRYHQFQTANVASALIWGVGYTLLGYFAGNALPSIERYSGWVGSGVLIAMIAFFVAFHFVKRRRGANLDEAWLREHPDADSAQDVP
jgi:membrane-associated protein